MVIITFKTILNEKVGHHFCQVILSLSLRQKWLDIRYLKYRNYECLYQKLSRLLEKRQTTPTGVTTMGIGRIFSRGGTGGFSKIFPGGPKVVKFVFSHSKLKKQPFLLKISKSRGALAHSPLLPTPMVATTRLKNTAIDICFPIGDGI